MMPVNFIGSNMVLTKPANMTDEQCSETPALRGTDDDGFPYHLTCWQPSREDIQAITHGKPIYLKVLGASMPPVVLFTIDDNGEANNL